MGNSMSRWWFNSGAPTTGAMMNNVPAMAMIASGNPMGAAALQGPGNAGAGAGAGRGALPALGGGGPPPPALPPGGGAGAGAGGGAGVIQRSATAPPAIAGPQQEQQQQQQGQQQQQQQQQQAPTRAATAPVDTQQPTAVIGNDSVITDIPNANRASMMTIPTVSSTASSIQPVSPVARNNPGINYPSAIYPSSFDTHNYASVPDLVMGDGLLHMVLHNNSAFSRSPTPPTPSSLDSSFRRGGGGGGGGGGGYLDNTYSAEITNDRMRRRGGKEIEMEDIDEMADPRNVHSILSGSPPSGIPPESEEANEAGDKYFNMRIAELKKAIAPSSRSNVHNLPTHSINNSDDIRNVSQSKGEFWGWMGKALKGQFSRKQGGD